MTPGEGVPRVAYMGPAGSFSEDATHRFFGEDVDAVLTDDIPEAIQAVGSGRVDAAVVPIENSVEGGVNVTTDALIECVQSGAQVRIVGEQVLRIHLDLVGAPGTALEDIRAVIANPHALAQCRVFVRNNLPSVEIVPAMSNSRAAQSVADRPGIGAIGNRRSAALYGLACLAEDIQDSPMNKTRFVVLGDYVAPRSGQDKTSLCCSIVKDRPGSLVAILTEFAARSINLVKIESRPTGSGLGHYYFLIDAEGHESDESMQEALGAVKARSSEIWIFGSYPASADV